MSSDTAPQEPERPANATSAEKKPSKRPKLLIPVVLVLVFAGGLYGLKSWSFGRTHATTDDAQVSARVATVSPKITGTVRHVYVDDNEEVPKGKLLVELDPSIYQIAVEQAEANLDLAEAQENQAEVSVRLTSQTGSAQVAQAQGGVGQSVGAVGSSRSEVERAVAAVATARSQASGAEATVKGAQAAYQVAVANVRKAQDGVREAEANSANARAAVSSAQASVVSARATEDRTRKDNERYQQLLSQGVVSAQSADQTLSAFRVATAQREAAEQNVRAAQSVAQQRGAAIATAKSSVTAFQAQADQALTQIQVYRVAAIGANDAIRQATAVVGTAQGSVVQAQGKVQQAQGVLEQANTAATQLEVSRVALVQVRAKVKQAKAALSDAKISLNDTKIYAPIAGRVSRRTVTLGQPLTRGTALMQIVPSDEIWVIANFKETQLSHVEVGQPVEIEADALGGDALKGHVASLSPGTGALFALLPPDNSTGNFTKVVQRVPVKITFDSGDPRLARLAVGMSVTATIDTAERKAAR